MRKQRCFNGKEREKGGGKGNMIEQTNKRDGKAIREKGGKEETYYAVILIYVTS
jgi:hypothetical protein